MSPPSIPGHSARTTSGCSSSTTDPEARLARKGAGQEAMPGFSGHVLMENRHGLCVDLPMAPASGPAQRDMALTMRQRRARRGIRPRTLGTDTGDHGGDFVRRLRR